jgi:uncharacterized protein (TIGR02145 family)
MKKIVSLYMLLFCMQLGFTQTVKIGTQLWMTKNLNVDKFRNGDPIPYAETTEEWKMAADSAKPAWCYFKGIPENGLKYGKLYNWYAVNDPRGIAPIGYHVPSDSEWEKLEQYLGYGAGKKIKSKTGWGDYYNGTNESGFSGFQCGFRFDDGKHPPYNAVGANWWSSTEKQDIYGGCIKLDFDAGNYLNLRKDKKGMGYSVRCLKD